MGVLHTIDDDDDERYESNIEDILENSSHPEQQLEDEHEELSQQEKENCTNQFEYFEMMLDGGADRHMVKELYRLSDVRLLQTPVVISQAEKSRKLIGTHSGTLNIEIKSRNNSWVHITLDDVLYVPNLSRNLISGELIVSTKRYCVNYSWNFADIIEVETNSIVCSAITRNKGKWFDVRKIVDNANVLVTNTESNDTERKKLAILWHRRLGHASAKVIKQMPNHTLDFPPDLKI